MTTLKIKILIYRLLAGLLIFLDLLICILLTLSTFILINKFILLSLGILIIVLLFILYYLNRNIKNSNVISETKIVTVTNLEISDSVKYGIESSVGN
jgi:hypothetical protein